MTEESKYCSDVMKKHFNKELVMTKEGNEDFKNSTKCLIWDNEYIDTDVKVRDHCYIFGKYRGSAHRDCNINLKSQNSYYISQPIELWFSSYQELGKFNVKISVMPNGLEKYMSFTINSKSSFIGSFQFRSSSLDSSVKNLNK